MQKRIKDHKPDSSKTVPVSNAIHYDAALLFPVLFLVGAGIVMVYSASSALALKKYGTEYYFMKKQALFSGMGLMMLVMCRHMPYRTYRLMSYPMMTAAVVMLLAIKLSGFGISAGGSARWLRIGGMTFQPSEFARLALVIYLAYSLSKKADHIRDFSIGFLPHVMVLGLLSALILMQPDFGSVVILSAITWIMMFIGGVRIRYLTGVLPVLLPAAWLCMIQAPYRLKRLMSFLDPWQYSNDAGYQIVHSLMAFGSGGIGGKGLGNGYQKLFYLPEPHTDFIFSVIGEETGLIGVAVITLCFFWIVIKGIRIAVNAGDLFGTYLAMGLTTAIGLQVCVNMGVALGLLPTKGLTLPFLSYGGTSLLINMASVGILMNIGARQAS